MPAFEKSIKLSKFAADIGGPLYRPAHAGRKVRTGKSTALWKAQPDASSGMT